MPTKNKALQKIYRDRWYYKNKEKQIKRQTQRRRELMEWLQEYKRTLSCNVCNMSFIQHPECCDFHHLTDKTECITRIAKYSKDALLKELNKCIPLCANCHRIITRKDSIV
jgi:predicted HNH restriction endonuclease